MMPRTCCASTSVGERKPIDAMIAAGKRVRNKPSVCALSPQHHVTATEVPPRLPKWARFAYPHQRPERRCIPLGNPVANGALLGS